MKEIGDFVRPALVDMIEYGSYLRLFGENDVSSVERLRRVDRLV